MARKRRGGGRRKSPWTVNNIIKAAPAAVGLVTAGKQMLDAYKTDKDVLHASTGIVVRGGQVSLDKAQVAAVAGPAIGGVVGSKVVGKLVSLEPAPLKRMLNAEVI